MRRFSLLSALWTVLSLSGATIADTFRGILAIDDVGDCVYRLHPASGVVLSEINLSNVSDPLAPFAVVRGPEIVHETEPYPDTLLVTDIRRRRIAIFDEITGRYLREWIDDVDTGALVGPEGGVWLVAAGRAGVFEVAASGTRTLRIAPDIVRGPNRAWGLLKRPATDNRPADILVSDPTLDTVFRFSGDGARLGVFCKVDAFRFPQQLAGRRNGNVLLADPLAGRVFEFGEDGGLLREIECPHPRGVIELEDENLLIASDEGIQVFDGASGERVATRLPGLPQHAIRMLTPTGCSGAGRGDLNGDGRVNTFDIDAFVLALIDETTFATQYPLVDRLCAGDINRDGLLNSFDIDPFVALLVGG